MSESLPYSSEIPVPAGWTEHGLRASAGRRGVPVEEFARRMAGGERHCGKCRRWRKADDFGANAGRQDGKEIFCRDCAPAVNRAHCRRQQTRAGQPARDKRGRPLRFGSAAQSVPVELFPLPAEEATISCLRCRHCALTESTNFRHKRPKVFCAKEGREITARLDGCKIADPRPQKPRALHRYWIKLGPLGDKLCHAGPVALAYLRARWASAPAPELERHTGWTMFKLAQIVRGHGVGGVATANNRLAQMDPRQGRDCFTLEQSAWLLAEYNSERWPKPAITRLPPDELARRQAAQRAVVDAVNAMNPEGPQWNWEQINRHLTKQKRKLGDHAKAARRGQGRRVNQFVTLPVPPPAETKPVKARVKKVKVKKEKPRQAPPAVPGTVYAAKMRARIF